LSVKVISTELGHNVTKDDGFFEIKNIPVGTYEIEFSGVAYKSYVLKVML
jgi:hypothetical protein